MTGAELVRAHVEPRVGRMEQLAAIRRYAFEDGKARGMRAFEVVNASGFAYAVYPDKGLDIGPASFNGLPVAWTSRNGAVAPAFYDGTSFEWLRTWSGGLVTTCGLLNVGGPCATAEGAHGLHGRMHHTPAEEVNTRAFWRTPEDYVLEIAGTIVHSRVFAENLVTRRTIVPHLGWPGVEVRDRTTNEGSAAMPLMRLYHMNFGWPLVDEGTRLVAPPHRVVPQNAYCEAHVGDWDRFAAPQPEFREQVFYHHDVPSGADGLAEVRLVNARLGIAAAVAWRTDELPYLVQWKMPGAGEYVTGLEPANCYPEGQEAFANRGLLRRIEPGETVETCVRVAIVPAESEGGSAKSADTGPLT